ncbi:MAG: isoprenylcysteine carboxylmethyltransferase family protein [Chloroflexi bacterium]|nr:isoprenylcysteine carboxylmethyltransferase family protein [Chloroflexota bacterium]
MGESQILTTVLAYILIALFFGVVDRRMRTGQEARSLDQTPSDAGTANLVGFAFFLTGLGLLAAPILNYLRIGALPLSSLFGWIGIAIALLGIALRWWAFKTLGEFYTRTLRVSTEQRIVRQGPYKLIRHPGYLASILIWLGAALATTNWIAVVIAAVVLSLAYHSRIQAEESMLLSLRNEEYGEYRAHTWKLIPFIY